jgi:hypothetical protein
MTKNPEQRKLLRAENPDLNQWLPLPQVFEGLVFGGTTVGGGGGVGVTLNGGLGGGGRNVLLKTAISPGVSGLTVPKVRVTPAKFPVTVHDWPLVNIQET